MPDTLALEWEHEQIAGVLATVSAGHVRVKQSFLIPRTGGGASTDAIPADWLKSELSKKGISYSGEVLVTLPRDDAFVRRLELPDTPDNELPTMVRFQMGAKSSMAMDEQCLDFLPLVRRTEMPGRDVLAATVSKQLVESIRIQCQGAGATLASVGFTPAAVAELVARAELHLPSDRNGVSLVVGRFGRRLEISVFRTGALLFSHSARLNQDPDAVEQQSIVPEVSRALVALRGAIADVKIEHAWMLVGPTEQEVLATALQRRLSCEVQPIDPLAWLDRDGSTGIPEENIRSQFAGPIGMLLGRSDPKVIGIDFLNPRKTVVKKDNRKQRLIMAGVGVGTLVATLLGAQFFRLGNLDSDIEGLTNRGMQLDAEIKKGKPTDNALALVETWQGEGVDWLGQFGDFTQRMPATDRMYLESLQFTKLNNQPAKIVAHGFAREKKDVMALASGLHTSDRYRVKPYLATQSQTDSYYPWKIDGQEILLNEPKKEKGGGKKGTKGVKEPKVAEEKEADGVDATTAKPDETSKAGTPEADGTKAETKAETKAADKSSKPAGETGAATKDKLDQPKASEKSTESKVDEKPASETQPPAGAESSAKQETR
ncbi:MAG: hypothetical protein NT069_30790 [Planctomycetota bacterium]|nr:hypothetical protein [Planctomycetota bacterium]